MSFFSVGNLLTLGITALAFILYHQLNRRNASGLSKLREYIRSERDKLAGFISEKEAAVRDYGIDLDVRQQSAKELLNRITLTDADLKKKADAITRIDERISGYDASLEELVRMTGRVEENLNRIQEESVFVDTAVKRIGQAEEKLKSLELELSGIKNRFTAENQNALEQAADATLAEIRSAVADLESTAETIGRRVEDHREAVVQIEGNREARMAEAEDHINGLLDGALAQAGEKAEKLEDAALVKLREQALDRVKRYQETVESRLKDYQETTKATVAEAQGLVGDLKKSWAFEHAELQAREKVYHDEISGNIAAMDERFTGIEERVTKSAERLENLLASAMSDAKMQAQSLAGGELERWQAAVTEEDNRIRGLINEWQAVTGKKLEELETASGEGLEKWRLALKDEDTRSRQFLAERDASIALEAAQREQAFDETISQLEGRIRSLSSEVEAGIARHEADLNTALEEAETRAGAKAQEAFSRWAEAAEAEQTGRIEEAEKIASRRREALETEELQWQENAEGQFSRWKRDFDANVSIWRAETEAAWKELQGSTETEYQELTRAGEEASTRWREAEQRWKRAEEEIAGAVEEMRERLAKAERQSGESAAALRKNFGETAAELQAALNETAERLQSGLEGTDSRLRKALEETDTRLQKALEETTGSLQRTIAESSFDSGQKALEDADKRLEVYRAAQSQQFKNLESLADDTARLESELRQAMETAENRVREDFALFESASAQERADASNAFDEAAEDLRIKLAQIEREVEALKEKAYDNVSEKLNIFEEDFAGDLVKRGGAIQEKLDAWQEAQDRALAETGTGLEKRRAEMEFSLLDELKTRISEQRERTEADLERLKSEAEAYETGIRERMVQGDESLETYKNQMMGNLAEARVAADNQVKAEIGRFSLSMAENLKQARRDMEEWQEGITTEIKETDQAVEDLRRKSQELSADSDERLAAVRSSITGVNRQIQEFVDQTKLFEQAEKLKTELERRIEDLKGDMDGLDQRRSEAAELENQFTRIRRLEDEINAKMTRFLSEQRRIDLMEADFNRLLQTSQSVEEKLSEVSSSDDLLQGIQVQLRKINDALADTEEKYKRIEKKNLTLENINLGVDRNFKTLQETESSLKNLVEDLGSLRAEEGELRLALETLYEKNEQAQVTADKLTVLEQDLSTVEERIKTMQVAREWIAQAETRMQNLNREIQSQLKLMGEITRDDGDGPIRGSNPDSLITRENVHRLHRQGWVDDEIARTLKLSIGEVKLILEVPPQKGG